MVSEKMLVKLLQQNAKLIKMLTSRQKTSKEVRHRIFREKKYGETKEDFETFKTTYDSQRLLVAGNFGSWDESSKVAFLVSAVKEKALEVVRALITLHKNALAYVDIWKKFEAAFKDTAEKERAL